MSTLRALAVTVPLLFGSGPLVNVVTDWEIVLPGGETMCATGRDTCEDLRAAIERGTAYPGAPAPGSTTICRPHPGCFTAREGCIPHYQGPRPEGYCR